MGDAFFGGAWQLRRKCQRCGDRGGNRTCRVCGRWLCTECRAGGQDGRGWWFRCVDERDGCTTAALSQLRRALTQEARLERELAQLQTKRCPSCAAWLTVRSEGVWETSCACHLGNPRARFNGL